MLHPVGDVEGMAQSAIALLTDDARWSAMGAAAVKRASSRFDQDTIVARYESLYAGALANA